MKASVTVSSSCSPVNGGRQNEIGPRNGRYSFEKEHHSAWYRLNIAADADLCLEILPLKLSDDYDFMLFKMDNANGSSSLAPHEVPVRACISRNKEDISGRTGMKTGKFRDHVKEGPGESFVNTLPVKKGESYVLVIDNVYDEGGGFVLDICLEMKKLISGQVTDERMRPVEAEVTITGNRGDTLVSTRTDKEGFYAIETGLKLNSKYTLSYFGDKAFFVTRDIGGETPTDSLRNIRTVLPQLKKGKKYNVNTIHFYGGSPTWLTASEASVYNLFRLMKKNNGLKIHIVGHTNGCLSSGPITVESLSWRRALSIRKYLVSRGIEPNRITEEGRECSEMLYPERGPEWQQMLNRRVEIKVLEL